MDQPDKVANPAPRDQLKGKISITLSAFAPEKFFSRDGFGSPVPRQLAHLHTQAESGAYLRDSSRLPRRRPFIYSKPPYATIGSVPSLSGPAIAYRWCSLPRVRRHRTSTPQGNSERVLPRQVIMCNYFFVFFPFILDIKFIGRTSRGHTGGRSHRISHPPSFCGARLNFSCEKDSAFPFHRRP